MTSVIHRLLALTLLSTSILLSSFFVFADEYSSDEMKKYTLRNDGEEIIIYAYRDLSLELEKQNVRLEYLQKRLSDYNEGVILYKDNDGNYTGLYSSHKLKLDEVLQVIEELKAHESLQLDEEAKLDTENIQVGDPKEPGPFDYLEANGNGIQKIEILVDDKVLFSPELKKGVTFSVEIVGDNTEKLILAYDLEAFEGDTVVLGNDEEGPYAWIKVVNPSEPIDSIEYDNMFSDATLDSDPSDTNTKVTFTKPVYLRLTQSDIPTPVTLALKPDEEFKIRFLNSDLESLNLDFNFPEEEEVNTPPEIQAETEEETSDKEWTVPIDPYKQSDVWIKLENSDTE